MQFPDKIIRVMDCRYDFLEQTMLGYDKTGVPLIAANNGNLYPAGNTDDLGIYYYIPKICKFFSIPLDKGINLFFSSIIIFSSLLAIIGLLLLFKKPFSRGIGIIGIILISCVQFLVGDLYIVMSSIPVAVVPIFLYLLRSGKRNFIFGFLFIAGLIISFSNFIRGNSGYAIALFIVMAIVLFKNISLRLKITYISILIVGVIIMSFFNYTLIKNRDDYMKINNIENTSIGKHVLWHSIYIGLGYLNNDYGIKYLDEYAMEKVKSIDPNVEYCSNEYEKILKQEVFSFVINHKYFTFETLSAKFGVVLAFIILFANIGLIIAIKNYRQRNFMYSPFGIALLFNSAYGLLVAPKIFYLLGLIAFSALFGIISLCSGIEYYLDKNRGILTVEGQI